MRFLASFVLFAGVAAVVAQDPKAPPPKPADPPAKKEAPPDAKAPDAKATDPGKEKDKDGKGEKGRKGKKGGGGQPPPGGGKLAVDPVPDPPTKEPGKKPAEIAADAGKPVDEDGGDEAAPAEASPGRKLTDDPIRLVAAVGLGLLAVGIVVRSLLRKPATPPATTTAAAAPPPGGLPPGGNGPTTP